LWDLVDPSTGSLFAFDALGLAPDKDGFSLKSSAIALDSIYPLGHAPAELSRIPELALSIGDHLLMNWAHFAFGMRLGM
jgi:hypothetical protein